MIARRMLPRSQLVNLDDLDAQLEQDTAGQAPPFGARSVQLARDLGPAATDLLLDRINRAAPSAFLALEALRASDPQAFERIPAEQRARIYADALRESLFFNAWGLPGYKLTDTALAFIALGEPAVTALTPLLGDSAQAPLEGSEDSTTSSAYGNRICDYAWVFINEIRKKDYAYPESVAERDQGIRDLTRTLGESPAELP
jgi:hypothetical protein